MRQGKLTPAKRLFDHLLKVLPTSASESMASQIELEARLGLAEVEEAAGDFGMALAELSTLNVSNNDIADAPVRAKFFAILGRLNTALGNEEVGQGYFRRASGKWHAEEGYLWQPCDRILEYIHVLGASFRVAIDHLAHARQTARRRGLVVDEAAMSAMICILQAAKGNAESAMAESQTAADQAELLGDSRLMAASLHVKGVVHTWCGDTPGALRAFDKAIELAVRSGDLPRLYSIYGFRGQAQVTMGCYAESIADLDTALDMGAKLSLRFSRPLFQAWKAGALAEAGDHGSAVPAAVDALNMAVSANRPWAHSVGTRAMACALAQPDVGDFARAERAIRMALSEQVTLGIEFERTRSIGAFARILRSAGKTPKSAGMIQKAKEAWRSAKLATNRKAVRAPTTALCRPCSVSS